MPVKIQLEYLEQESFSNYYSQTKFFLKYRVNDVKWFITWTISNYILDDIDENTLIKMMTEYFVEAIEKSHGVKTGTVMHEYLIKMMKHLPISNPVVWTFPLENETSGVLVESAQKLPQYSGPFQKEGSVAGIPVSKVSRRLPGMDTKVDLPCYCAPRTLWNAIQHLNDGHDWTREEIADWMDRLHDDGTIDIEFKEPLKVSSSSKSASQLNQLNQLNLSLKVDFQNFGEQAKTTVGELKKFKVELEKEKGV